MAHPIGIVSAFGSIPSSSGYRRRPSWAVFDPKRASPHCSKLTRARWGRSLRRQGRAAKDAVAHARSFGLFCSGVDAHRFRDLALAIQKQLHRPAQRPVLEGYHNDRRRRRGELDRQYFRAHRVRIEPENRSRHQGNEGVAHAQKIAQLDRKRLDCDTRRRQAACTERFRDRPFTRRANIAYDPISIDQIVKIDPAPQRPRALPPTARQIRS